MKVSVNRLSLCHKHTDSQRGDRMMKTSKQRRGWGQLWQCAVNILRASICVYILSHPSWYFCAYGWILLCAVNVCLHPCVSRWVCVDLSVCFWACISFLFFYFACVFMRVCINAFICKAATAVACTTSHPLPALQIAHRSVIPAGEKNVHWEKKKNASPSVSAW